MSPPQLRLPGGAGEEASSSFVSGLDGAAPRSQSRGKGPGQPAGCTQCHGCSASRPAPCPSCLPVAAFLRLSACLPFPALPLFSSCLPSFLSFFPLSFILIRFLLSFPPSFLPSSLWGPGAVLQSCCRRLSRAQSLSGSVLMSSWSQSGPGPSERSAALLSIASSHPRTRQGPRRQGWGRC